MALNSESITGLDALAFAALEVEPSSDAESESETRRHPQGDQVPPPDAATELRQMMTEVSETFTRQMSALNRRMDNLERDPNSQSSTPRISHTSRSRDSYQPPRLWADRPLNEPLPDLPLVWPDEDEEDRREERGAGEDTAEADDGCTLHRVSAATETLLDKAFSKPVSNNICRRWRTAHGMPATDTTKCPKLDMTLRPQIPKEAREADRSLCRLQTLVLDAVGPLSAMLELHRAGKLTPEAAVEAATQSLKIPGQHPLQHLLREEKESRHEPEQGPPPVGGGTRAFFQSSPLPVWARLWEVGEGARRISALAEKAKRPVCQLPPGQLFRQGRSHQAARGSGPYNGSSRGGGRGRFRPYQNRENQTKPRPRDQTQK